MKIKYAISFVLFIIGSSLTICNIYGLFQDIRPPVFFQDELRFQNDISLTHQETQNEIIKKTTESDESYTTRLTSTIAQGLAHVLWGKYPNTQFNQLVPIWENYFLYFMGRFSNIPEFERYHFADYQKSLARGIGICGDASMIMSQLLDKYDIENQIITFPEHVIISAKFSDKEPEKLYDPDFGVALPFTAQDIQKDPSIVNKYYDQAGYFDYDIARFNSIYKNDFERWDGVKHIITKKYYFEKISYILKWPFPIILIVIALYYIRANQHRLSVKRKES